MRQKKTKGIARSIKERAERIGRTPFQDEAPIEIDEDELLYEELDRLTRTMDTDDELRAMGLTNGIGRTNGLINGLGRTNGLINGNGRTNGLVNGVGRINGLINGTGRTNGLVNGVGRTNGLINGIGRTNGMINGNGWTNGLINGIGRTNGKINGSEVGDYEYMDEGFEDPKGRRPRRRKLALVRYSAIIMGLLFLFSVSISLIPEEPGKPPRITVDGQLTDWSGIERYNEPASSENSDVDLETYAVLSERDVLSVLMTVRGTALGDPTGYDAFYLFVDADDSEATGYLHEGLGVDYAIEIYGSSNSVKTASILEFQPGDQHNWSAFTRIGSINAAVSGSNLEAQIPIALAGFITEDSIFTIHTDDFIGGGLDSSLNFREELGALEVTFQAVEEDCIVASVQQDLVQLTFAARGSEVAVNSVSITIEGLGQLESVAPFNLPSSQVTVRTVGLSSLTADPGDLITITLNEVRADRPVKIRGESVKCYYQSAPSEKKIDGWFGDWSGEAEIDTQNLPLDQASRDIKEYSASLEPTLNETFFYARVFGEMLEGSSVPRKILKSLAVQGDPNPVPAAPRLWKEKRTGEDFLRIYIDSNTSDVDGAHINNFPLIPDYMIQVTGKNGVILNRSVFEWGPGWDFLMSIPAEKNMDSIEISVPSWLFGSMNNTGMLFDMTDWRSLGDSNSLQTAWQSRSGTRTVYVVQNTNNAATTTAYSTQRKVFHDGTYFWSFYYDGVQGKTMYEYSDEGDDWTNTAVSAFSTSGVLYPSVWYDSGNSAVYIVGDTSASDATVITRKGTISGTSISWGSEYTVTVSGSSIGSKVAFIGQDSSGYLWVISSSQETNYNCAAVRSTNTDDISAWDSRTVMRTAGDVTNNYVFPMIYPLSGGDMYAIWYADGNIEGRGYTSSGSSWDANEVSIASTSASKTNRGPSVVVDSSGTVHLIYSDTSGYIQYEYKTSGGSWTSGTDPEGSQTANAYPTLTLLTSNDNLYAFYIRSNQIYCKKWTGSSWSSVTLTTDTQPKVHLTSVYSVANDYRIGWDWREYDGFNEEYNIIFERIPEFSDILPPFLGILFVSFASRKLKGRKR